MWQWCPRKTVDSWDADTLNLRIWSYCNNFWLPKGRIPSLQTLLPPLSLFLSHSSSSCVFFHEPFHFSDVLENSTKKNSGLFSPGLLSWIWRKNSCSKQEGCHLPGMSDIKRREWETFPFHQHKTLTDWLNVMLMKHRWSFSVFHFVLVPVVPASLYFQTVIWKWLQKLCGQLVLETKIIHPIFFYLILWCIRTRLWSERCTRTSL